MCVSIQVVHPQCSTDTATAGKKSCFNFVREIRFPYNRQPVHSNHAFPMHMLTTLLVDEILLPRYVNWFINFRGLPLKVEMTPCWKHRNSILFVFTLRSIPPATYKPYGLRRRKLGEPLDHQRSQRLFVVVFDDRSTQRACVAQGLFYGGSERRAVAHPRPSFPKMTTAPSAFLLSLALQAPGDEPNPPEVGKSLGGRPPETEGNLQVPRHTRPDPCRR